MLRILLVFLSIIYCASLQSQNFSEEDKEGLRRILRQPSTLSGKSNLECVGLTAADTANWKTSEAWIAALQNQTGRIYIDWEWSVNIPARLVRLEVKSFTDEYRLSGALDGSYFQELETLNVPSCAFSAINIPDNPALRYLDCSDNGLLSLDLSRNLALMQLNIAGNELTELNLSHNADLGVLNCSGNRLTALDLSKQANLVSLYCAANSLTSLNLTANQGLTTLDCADNAISGLDLTSNSKLTFLSCSGNSLNASMNMAEKNGLKTVYAADAGLKNVNVSQNQALMLLYSPNNDLTSLDLSANVNLDWLDCSGNRLTQLKVGHGLSALYFGNNRLKFSAMQVGDASEHGEIQGLTQLVDGGSIQQGTAIELNSEYEIYGNITTFQWFDGETPVSLLDLGNGVFYADPGYLYKTLTCNMTNASFPETTISYSVMIDTITNSESIDGVRNQLAVYPNPVRDVLNIKLLNPVKSVELYDTAGRLVKKIVQESLQYEIAVSDLSQGLYVLKAVGGAGRALTTKIEKK